MVVTLFSVFHRPDMLPANIEEEEERRWGRGIGEDAAQSANDQYAKRKSVEDCLLPGKAIFYEGERGASNKRPKNLVPIIN